MTARDAQRLAEFIAGGAADDIRPTYNGKLDRKYYSRL